MRFFIITLTVLLLTNITVSAQDTLSIVITANNLSENAGEKTSNNDEILFLVYQDRGNDTLGEELLSSYFILDSKVATKTIPWSPVQDIKDYTFIIVEIDDEEIREAMKSRLRVYHRQLYKAYEHQDYANIANYLGKNSMLAYMNIKDVMNTLPHKAVFNRYYNEDKYDYQIEIKK